MIDRTDLAALWDYVKLVAPAPIGALIGMRYAVDQTPKGRALTFLCACVLGGFGGAGVGERFGLSPSEVAIATITAAATGMEILAGLVLAARTFAADPFGVLGKALDIAARVFRRGGTP